MRLYSVSYALSFLVFTVSVSFGQARLDFSSHDFSVEDEVDLAGMWEFFWNELLEPADFDSSITPEYIQVPGKWQAEKEDRTLGYGTYRVRLVLPASHKGLSLYFPIINSAAKVWVNNSLAAETGRVSNKKENYWPRLMGTIVPLPDDAVEVTIILQVANFTYFSGGISSMPTIGRSAAIFQRINRANGIEDFFAGSLIAMFIYQLMLFFLNVNRKPYLFLALICLGVALRALIVHGGSFLLPNLYPSVHWEIWKKIEFGSVYGMVALFPAYIYYLFPNTSSKRIQQLFAVIGIVLCLPVIAFPHYIYGRLLEMVHLFLLLTFVYAFYSVTKAWRSGNKDARVILFGVMASFPFILTEILQNSVFTQLNIRFDYLVELGLLVFLLFQVYILARHYSRAYRRLQVSNRELERMVSDRTLELATSNSVKDRLLSVMSHDIKSPLNSLRGILNIYNTGALKKDEFDHFTKVLEGDLHKTSLLVENILFWTKNQIKGVEVKLEDFDLTELITEILGLFQTLAANKQITLLHNLNGKLIIHSDRSILDFVVRNLTANAIKFSRENTQVNVEVEKGEQGLMIKIKDQGVGMDDETLRNLCAPELISSSSGTSNEKGTGLGLSLCMDYLEKIGGEIVVDSLEGSGSTFTILLKKTK